MGERRDMRTTFDAKIVKSGNSCYIRIPKHLMDIRGLREGDVVTVTIEKEDR
jgi:antitoxin component of MazEF toxin-antitoxin module